MKHILVLLAVVCLVGCGSPFNPAAPGSDHTSTSITESPVSPALSASAASTQTYDMLLWMTMSPSLRFDHHMAGTANPIYTSVRSNMFFWTKTGQGYPWDIQLFDANFIYLWVTELDWNNPRSFKAFKSPRLGKFNLPLVPRWARGGYPGSTIKITDSTYEIHTDCNAYTTHNLKNVINEVWGPYRETLGGNLPPNLQTLVISYRYGCDSKFSNCSHKEEFHVAQPYGLVKWQHQKLQSDGTYARPDNVSVMNRVVAGQTQPITSCF